LLLLAIVTLIVAGSSSEMFVTVTAYLLLCMVYLLSYTLRPLR
jgi:hypothetical protein